MRRLIPNLITLCNLTCGVVSIWYAQQGALTYASIAILAGIFFDFFDGMAARLLNVASPLGKELDSLADVVTSGVAPAFLLFSILQSVSDNTLLPFVAFLIPAFSAYRLAKFNLDERQHTSFLGLPTPANAIIWVGIALIYDLTPTTTWLFSAHGAYLIAAVSILTDILLVSELPLFSLKVNFRDLSWHSNNIRYIFLIGCALLIVTLRYYSIPLIILWYLLLSMIYRES